MGRYLSLRATATWLRTLTRLIGKQAGDLILKQGWPKPGAIAAGKDQWRIGVAYLSESYEDTVSAFYIPVDVVLSLPTHVL